LSNEELERFVKDWAEKAAQASVAGDTLRLQQNENYFRRVMIAHVESPEQREALSILRRALFQQAIDRAA